MRRVVVTGLGMVSPLGVGVADTWSRLIGGESGIRRIENFDVSDLPAKIAGQVPRGEASEGRFNPDDYVPVKDQKKMDDFIIYAMAAAKEAIHDSGWLPQDAEGQERTGVMIGSGIGGLPAIYNGSVVVHEKGPRRLSPFFIPQSLINEASGHVSIAYGFKGPNHAVVTACATGAHAISRIGMAGFAACRALSTSYNEAPSTASRPFDEGRDGFVMGEGAGIVVLEELEHAKKRGAKIYAEVVGYGMSGDAYHLTAPAEDGNGGFRAMQAALKRAGMTPSDIDYINAHGTSTPLGDEIEVGAVKRLFGNAINTVSMSSTKSAIGHLLGAAGAVEAIFSIKAIQNDLAPPTLNLNNPSEACQGVDLVPLQAKQRPIRAVLSNSFGFGGTNASLIFKELQ
jgi:3-oxoacyl-[acyl-carrier-protein] synthase II